MASVNDPLVALEEHWAVATFGAEQRAALVAFAEDALRALRSGMATQRPQPAVKICWPRQRVRHRCRERLDPMDWEACPDEGTRRRSAAICAGELAPSVFAAALVDFDDRSARFGALFVVALAHVAACGLPVPGCATGVDCSLVTTGSCAGTAAASAKR